MKPTRTIRNAIAWSVTAATMALCPMAARSATITINGDTTGGPSWHRTDDFRPGLSLVGTAVRYQSIDINILNPAMFRAEIVLPTRIGFDTYLHLYRGSFDPEAQFTNLVAVDDDGARTILLSEIDAPRDGPFAPGRHVVVVGGHGAIDFGRFILELDGVTLAFGPSDDAFVNGAIAGSLGGFTGDILGLLSDRAIAPDSGAVTPVAGEINALNAPTGVLGIGPWVRARGAQTDAQGNLNGAPGSARYDETSSFVQGGFSSALINDENGKFIASVFGHYGTSNSDVRSGSGVATGDFSVESYGVGASLSWMSTAGYYAGGAVLYSGHGIDTTTSAGVTGKTDGDTVALSVEGGWKIPVSENWAVVPQGVLTYQFIEINNYTNSAGTLVKFSGNDSLEGRAGVRIEGSLLATPISKTFTASAEANIVQQFLNGGSASIAGTPLGIDTKSTALDLAAGFSMTPFVSGVQLWSKVGYRVAFGDGRETLSWSGGLGVAF